MHDWVSTGWVRTTGAAASSILVAVVFWLASPAWAVAVFVLAGVALAVLGGLRLAGRSTVSVQQMIADIEAGPRTRPTPSDAARRKP